MDISMQQEKHYRKILNIDVYLKKYLSKSEKQYWKKDMNFLRMNTL